MLQSPTTARLYVGTYEEDGGQGVYSMVLAHGRCTIGVPERSIKNASYATYSSRHDLYYMLDERADGGLNVVRRIGRVWSVLRRCSTQGAAPCFVSLNRDQSLLAVANYASGNVAIFALAPETGLPLDPPFVHNNCGNGPNRLRQAGPHAHCARFRGVRLYSTDLGADTVLMHQPGDAWRTRRAFIAPAGEGPRHIVFHPRLPIAYLLTELGNKVFVLTEGKDGQLVERQRISTLPGACICQSKAGHLALNARGDRLYASNRGHDSIVVFTIHPDGALTLEQVAPAGGVSPRCFVLVPNYLLAANDSSGSVTVLQVRPDGLLGALVQTLAVKGAAFIACDKADGR